MTQNKNDSHLLKGSIVCLLSALFFVYEFLIQVSPSVMTQELMRDLQIGAGSLGVLSAFYYAAYTPMQIPAGLLFDRYGPRLLLTLACFICALGALAFGVAHSLTTISAGRFLMGIGSAFAFTGTLLLASRWFPSHYFAILAGMLQMLSSIGMLIGTAPLANAVHVFGWRSTILCLAFVGFLLTLLIAVLVRDDPHKNGKLLVFFSDQNRERMSFWGVLASEWQRLKQVCKHSQSWLLAFYSFTSWGPILVFPALWAELFFMAKYNVTLTEAAAAASMAWWGVAIGSPAAGWLSERMGQRRFPLILCAFLGTVSAIAMIYLPVPFWMIFLLMGLVGLAAGSQTLTFAVVKDNNDPMNVGSAMGFNNMMVVAGGLVLQPLVGFILHAFWDGKMVDNMPVYSLSSYYIALSIVPLVSFIGLILSLYCVKETYCRPTYTQNT